MGGKVDEVSAFEAKTRLSELLRETERGRSFVIRRRGKAVARRGLGLATLDRHLITAARRAGVEVIHR